MFIHALVIHCSFLLLTQDKVEPSVTNDNANEQNENIISSYIMDILNDFKEMCENILIHIPLMWTFIFR